MITPEMHNAGDEKTAAMSDETWRDQEVHGTTG